MRNRATRHTKSLFKGALLFLLLLSLVACTAAPRKQLILDDGGVPNDLSQLSAKRINEIRGRFVGRTFILKEDWYEYAYIDSDPVGGFGETPPKTDLPQRIKNNSAYLKKVAPAGTIARIVGTNTSAWAYITFICQTKDGQEFYIPILGRRPWTIFFGMRNTGTVQRNRYDDDLATIPWIERMLTYNTVEFVAAAPETGRPAGPAVAGPSTEPTVLGLTVAAVPTRLRKGGTVQLQLDFQVSGTRSKLVPVREERTLYFNGRVLPSYPKRAEAQRLPGAYKTATQQVIPNGAQAGDYEFKGEVCVLSNCVSRKTTFTVLP